MLRGFRDEWDMDFAESGAEALARLAEAPFDVIVSDMRMPGMDGAQLLGEVMRLYPDMARLVLSGQSEQETIMRAVGPAHQYLSKPCDPEVLKVTVARACALRDKLSQSQLKGLVSQVTSLPSLPNIYTALVEELQSPEASIQRVAELISRDVGMSAKLMQLVNSSFFGLPRRVESPSHAATMLGLNLLGPLVLSAGIFSQFDEKSMQGYSLDVLVEHSMAVSTLAKRLAESHNCEKQLAENAVVSGLLHDVGQLILVQHAPRDYKNALARCKEQQITLCTAENAVFGTNHADVGAYLLGLWGLPDPIVEAVAFHHEPAKCPHSGFCPLTAVHIANVLENGTRPNASMTLDDDLDGEYLARLGLPSSKEHWQEVAEPIAIGAPTK